MSRRDIDLSGTKAAQVGKILAVVIIVLAALALVLGIMELHGDLRSGAFSPSLIPLYTEKMALITAFFVFAVIGVFQLVREKNTQLLSWAFLAETLAGIMGIIYDVTYIQSFGLETEGLWSMPGYLTFDIVTVLAGIGIMLFCMGKLSIASGKAAIVVFGIANLGYLINWYSDPSTSKFSFSSVAIITTVIVAVTLLGIVISSKHVVTFQDDTIVEAGARSKAKADTDATSPTDEPAEDAASTADEPAEDAASTTDEPAEDADSTVDTPSEDAVSTADEPAEDAASKA